MKRILNYRIVTFVAVALCAGIVVGGLIYNSILLSVIIPIVSTAVGILLYFLTKRHTAWILFFTFALGTALFVTVTAATKPKLSGEYTLTLTVEEVGERSGNVFLDGEVGRVTLSGKDYSLKEGDRVVVTGTLTPVKFSYRDGYERYLFSKGVSYKLRVKEMTVTRNEPSFFQKIKQRSSDVMLRYMDKEDAAVCMSLVFGDKSMLSSKTIQETTGAGLSHVFAVSGLHIGFLAAILSYALKKCRVSPIPRMIVTVTILLLYGVLTGFPAGVKRSVIAYFLYELSVVTARKRDSLVTLSAAVVLIVLTDPKETFDIGFLLSVGAVAGIVFFYKPLYSAVGKLPDNVVKRVVMYPYGLICMTVSANIFILPITFSVFGTVTPYAAVGNLFVLPILSVVFPCLALVVTIALLFDGFGVLYYVFKYPIIAIRLFCSTISSWPGAEMPVAGLGVAALFYILFFVCASRFLLIKPKIKAPVCSALALSCVLCMLFL
ncbi:MAG: ComEC/Rec2 family competence protein [Clostridia bacterium]|nr:ComEC/Rec2 family competence protein [Clostridia bacterium]